jgi:LysR family glycine cleavage system transcriptional activator
MTVDEGWIPPFPALRAFHAAARHGRFKDAARVLNLTESAISHQVRRLEDLLQVQLFERQGPRVVLTPKGVRYFEDIDPAMTGLAAATRALVGPQERQRVTLTLPPSMAILWLIPNLAAFEADCPEIDLELVATQRVVELRREQIDIAIRHGRGGWPNVEAEYLMANTAIPVCRPGYLAAPADIGAARLIVNAAFPDEWREWAAAHGVAGAALEQGLSRALRFESPEQVMAAAEGGLGLALGRGPLVAGHLNSGALVAPFGLPERSQTGYFLCRAPGAVPSAGARRVWRWLHAFARRE